MVAHITKAGVSNVAMSSGRATDEQISRYLAELVRREIARGTGLRALAGRAGVSHAQLSKLKETDQGAGWKTLQGLARAFDKSLAQIEEEAAAYSATNPPRHQQAATRVEMEDARTPQFGSLPGWDEAEQLARERYQYVPNEAWEGARRMAGADWPSAVTPDFVFDAANLWLKHIAPAKARAQKTDDERARERAERARLAKLEDELDAAKRRR